MDLCSAYVSKARDSLRSRAYHFILIFDRSCSGSGQPALAFLDVYKEQAHFKPLLDELPTTLKVQMQIASISARAQKAFVEIGLVSMSSQQERTMDSLLKIFHGELKGLENSCSTCESAHLMLLSTLANTSKAWDLLYLAAACQDIAAMHFYKSAQNFDLPSSISVFETTARVLEQIRDFERVSRLSTICTRYILMTAFMGMTFLVRLLKGPFSSYLDQARGSTLYQDTLLFLRACSLEKTDLPDRAATAMEQIWRSEKIFKKIDGSADMTLRVRNRLSASPVYDAIRWWREEFVGHRHDVEPGQPGLSAGRVDYPIHNRERYLRVFRITRATNRRQRWSGWGHTTWRSEQCGAKSNCSTRILARRWIMGRF